MRYVANVVHVQFRRVARQVLDEAPERRDFSLYRLTRKGRSALTGPRREMRGQALHIGYEINFPTTSGSQVIFVSRDSPELRSMLEGAYYSYAPIHDVYRCTRCGRVGGIGKNPCRHV